MANYPAPWNLKGKGYIILYKFRKDFVQNNANLPEFLKDHFIGGLGSVMLVDYSSSDVGPYGEFLLIPGKFQHRDRKLNTISKIFVSTMESVLNGQENWGIPKEQADFNFQSINKNSERVQISINGTSVADMTLKSFGVKFPVNTKLLPFPLVQKHDNKYFYTQFFGGGTGQLAKIDHISINSQLFPDISSIKPIAVIKVNPFNITFPVPIIESLND